eukprot:12926868-Prorocentrum_lima.AAC.1
MLDKLGVLLLSNSAVLNRSRQGRQASMQGGKDGAHLLVSMPLLLQSFEKGELSKNNRTSMQAVIMPPA